MNRDMDLTREILLEVESRPPNQGGQQNDLPHREFTEVTYHAILLEEAGLIRAKVEYEKNIGRCYVEHLTWEGHEFLEAARSDKTWQHAVLSVGEKAGGLAYEVLKAVLR